MSLFTERFNKRPRSRPESLLVAQSYPLRGPLRGYDAPLAKLLLRVEEMQREGEGQRHAVEWGLGGAPTLQ